TSPFPALHSFPTRRSSDLPSINLVESAGANLPDQAKIFNLGGNNFKDISRRSKAGIPTISIVFGNSTAGGAYIPGMSDYTIFVRSEEHTSELQSRENLVCR